MNWLSAPTKVSIDVIDRCNLDCAHCRSQSHAEPNRLLTFNALTEIIDDLASMRVFRLALSGGEPFLRDDLEAIVEHAIRRGLPRIVVSTNGTLLNEHRLARLACFRDQITFKISIDGPPRVHDDVRGVRGAFDAAAEAIRLLRRRGFEYHVTTTLMRSNVSYLEETLRLVRDTGCSRHYVVEVLPRGRATAEMVLSPSLRKRAAETVRTQAARFASDGRAVFAKIPFVDGNRFGFECRAGVSECGILSDGLIVGCRLLPAIHEGYAQDSPLSVVWRSDDGFAYFRRALPGALGWPCDECADLAACRGGCRAFARRDQTDNEGPDARCPRAAQPTAVAVRA